ncbi:MAG: hypothetical protein J6S78_00060, partial [Lachnospiraceae bacterium]|nr:hypothetical protein [Lachnospiraceae bacterium]
MRRTYINTQQNLDYYVSTIRASGDAATENVPTDEITEITPYNFSGEILYVSNKGTNNTTYNGTYIYFGDAADYSAHPENYPEIDGVFYVTEVKPVIIVRKKIGASGYECLTVDDDISRTPRKSYHRDYTIYTVKGTPNSQVLFNFLDIHGVTNGNNLYRLVDTSSIAFIDADQNRNFLIHPNTNSLHMSMYKDMGLEEFDFAHHVLDITYGGVTLPYVYKSSVYVPEDEYFEPYYTIEIKKLSVETQLNHSQEWFEDPNGWIGGDDHSDWDGYDNDTVAYHRDYLATLHKSSHKVNVVWKDSDGTVLETDANVVGGTVPHYDGTAPAKASDSLYDYEWAGWSDGTNTYAPGDPLPKISSPDDITYTAVYNVTPKFATVSGYEGEYDKESHSITVELNEGIEATVEYSVKDTNGTTWSDWSTEAPAETNVCDKQVRVRVTYNEITSEVANPVVLMITKATAAVTVTGNNSTAVYDGADHSVTGYTFTSTNPKYTQDDFTYSGSQTATRKDVGTTQMGLNNGTFTNTNPNFESVTFSVTDGYQIITVNEDEIVVTITGHSNTSDYDGSEHTVSGYEVTINNDLYTEDDFSFSGTAEAKRTDAGTSEMGLDASQFVNTNTNFSDVTFVIIDGYQQIDPIDVTVTIVGANNTADYDGQAHSVTGYTASADSTLYDVDADIEFTGEATASQTDVGTANMHLTSAMFSNKNPNFRTVTFEITDGYQKVEPIDVTVTIIGKTESFDYDGQAHTVTGYTATTDNDLFDVDSDITFDGDATATRTDAGTTGMNLTSAMFSCNNPNFGTVTFNVTDGSVTIDPINVTVTIVGANDTVDYDGSEHTVSGYTATADSDLYDVDSDFTFSGTAEVGRTDAGTTDMGLASNQFTNTNPNFATVTFNVTDGFITISPINVTVTITGNNETVDFDGAEHTVSGYTATANSDLYDVDNDFTFSGNAEAKRTDAGTTEMGLAVDQFENINPNFATVTFAITDGYITINPIDVTVTIVGANSAVDYDGQEHSVSGYTATADSDLYDVDNDFTFSGSAEAKRTNAGTTNMGLAADQFTNTNPNFAAVTFAITDGFIQIDPIAVVVTITGKTDTAVYNGEDHTVNGYDVEISNPLYTEDDFAFNGSASATQRNVGKAEMGLNEDQFENTNPNFESVTFEVTDGYQEITPLTVNVTITGNTDTVSYDGTEHTVTGYVVTSDSTLFTEADVLINWEGPVEVKGTDAGTYEMGLTEDLFRTENANFAATFTVEDGSLVITPIDVTVTITGNNDSVDYDGTEHMVAGNTATADSDLYDTAADFTFSGNAEAKRTDAGTTEMGLASNQFTNTNTNFGTVTFVIEQDGSITINPINVTVTITGNNDTVDYDGEEHTVSG